MEGREGRFVVLMGDYRETNRRLSMRNKRLHKAVWMLVTAMIGAIAVVLFWLCAAGVIL